MESTRRYLHVARVFDGMTDDDRIHLESLDDAIRTEFITQLRRWVDCEPGAEMPIIRFDLCARTAEVIR